MKVLASLWHLQRQILVSLQAGKRRQGASSTAPSTILSTRVAASSASRSARLRLLLLTLTIAMGTTPALAQTPDRSPLLISQAAGLRQEASGDDVSALQRRLAELGYYNGPISGYFGSQTEEAVSRFQQDKGLTPDGVVGSATAAALQLNGGSQTNYTNARSALQLNDSGDQVSELQRRLAALGYYNGPISGWFGSQTQAAVASFQRDKGLTPDGVVGGATEDALRNASDRAVLPANSGTPAAANPAPTSSAAAPTPGLLRLGSSGAEVGNLQTRLQQLGFYSGAISGFYDQSTEAAVMAFQQSQGLLADGIAGPQVTAALNRTAAPVANGTAGTPAGQTVNPANDQAYRQLQQAQTEAEQSKQAADQARLEADQQRLVFQQNMQEGRYSVMSLQRQLQSHGYDPGGQNGILTPETRRAITSAQQSYGLSDNDFAIAPAALPAPAAAAPAGSPTSALPPPVLPNSN